MAVKLTDGSCAVAIDPDKNSTLAEEKSSVAHELGHCETGCFCCKGDTPETAQRNENRADKWAIEATVSQSDLQQAMSEGYTEIWSLAEHFDLPEEFMRKIVCWYKYGNINTGSYFGKGKR